MTEQINLPGDVSLPPAVFALSSVMLVQLVSGSRMDPGSFTSYREYALDNLPLPIDEERMRYISGDIFENTVAMMAHVNPNSRKAKKHGSEVAGRVVTWIGGLACSIEDLDTVDSAVTQLRSLGGRQNRKVAHNLSSKVKFTRQLRKISNR